MLANIKAWAVNFWKSPLNKAGLGLWAMGVVNAAATEAQSGKLSYPTLATFAVGGLVSIFVKDNIVVKQDAETLTADSFAAYASKNPAAITKVVNDAVKTAGDIANPTK